MRIYCFGIVAWTCCTAIWAQPQTVDSKAMRPYEAQATAVQGDVTRLRDEQPWALSTGEKVPVSQVIITRNDGYAHFITEGGNSFDIFSNSRVIFRQNLSNTGDLLDVLAGRVRVHLHPAPGHLQERVFCPSAIVSAHQPATVGLAVDEDNTVRIDVTEGEVRVQHTRLPTSEAVLVRAIDAVMIRPNEPISRRVDRGSLYRYGARIWAAITFSHNSHDSEPIEGNKLLAGQMNRFAF